MPPVPTREEQTMVVDDPEYAVVINDEEQYSILAAGREPPAGWRHTGFSGTKADCVAHIEQVWTDMRPRSVRLSMDGRWK
jgi:MbtH protein